MDSLLTVIEKHWRYATLRPLQREAMTAAMRRRDALVVMPTGGGKSLCYQAPALLADRPTVVISPLIALMKDQVDKLLIRNVPAAFFNSSLSTADRRRVIDGLFNAEYKLVFLAPERFADPHFLDLLTDAGVGAFAVDEAHCISHWGHDFRQDYRQLGLLKQRFPDTPVHAFTATATPRVRDDIIAQLGLNEPAVLVGDFFRPNLRYSVRRRTVVRDDVLEVIRAHQGEAGVVYCIRRDDVDTLAAQLESAGVRAIGYHAGMTDEARTRAQDAFAAAEVDVVVATVAFGMGIDRADIRFVVHAAMPKSIEHYQQETGRAGRDGKPADCVLFYSGADFRLWKSIIDANESTDDGNKLQMLEEMYGFCTGAGCRHRKLVTYFGQDWERADCNACDICLGDAQSLPDATVIAQKIMSCVVRTGERFGAGYVADVLLGTPTDRALSLQHNELSTFGLIPDQPKPTLMSWIDQLVDQGLLHREPEYRVLTVTPAGWKVLRSRAEAFLLDVGPKRRRKRSRSSKSETRKVSPTRASTPHGKKSESHPQEARTVDTFAWKDLFEHLRNVRRTLAEDEQIPAFMIFSDRTLREIARRRPTSRSEFLAVKGVGPAKCEAYADLFLNAIRSHSSA